MEVSSEVYQEIVAAEKDSAWKEHFQYARGMTRADELASELFAELFRASVMNPTATREALPKGYQYVEKIVSQAGGKLPNAARSGTPSPASGDRRPGSRGSAISEQADLDFSNLETDRFAEAYDIEPEKAVLLFSGDPIDNIMDALSTPEVAKDMLELEITPDQEQIDSMRYLLHRMKNIVKKMNKDLSVKNKNLSKVKEEGQAKADRLTPLEALEYTEKEFGEFTGTKLLNFVDLKEGVYDKRLVETAAIAAVHWLLNTTPPGYKKRADIAKYFGVEELI